MGLRDRLGAAKRWMWSPMEVNLLERGSDPRATAGERATVVVEVTGEDDGTAERIEVVLSLNYSTTWPLGEVPATIGTHRLEVEIPTQIPPGSGFTEYRFVGKLHRTKGTGSEGVSPVDIIARPEDLFWPEGPRSSGAGISLDAETFAIGQTVTGTAPPGTKVEVGPRIEKPTQVAGKVDQQQRETFEPVGEQTVSGDGRFAIELPDGPAPTLQFDRYTVIWQVKAGDAWHIFGVLDPECRSAYRNLKAAGLYDLFF